jgi:hypothetical protein
MGIIIQSHVKHSHTRIQDLAEPNLYVPGGDGGDGGGGVGGCGDGLGPRAMTDERDTSSTNSFSDIVLD